MADGRQIPATAFAAASAASSEHDQDGDPNDLHHHHHHHGGNQGETGFTPYARPSFFPVRLAGLVAFLILSLVTISLAILVVPVAYGRTLLKLIGLNHTPHHDALTLLVGVCSLMGWVKAVLW